MDREKVFFDVPDKKEAFRDYKKELCTKDAKLEFFLKGLVHGFGQKSKIL